MADPSDQKTRLLEEAFQAMPSAVAVFDRDGRFVFWNARFEAIYAEGAPIRAGVRLEDHLRRAVAEGRIPAAEGREEAWLAERLARFAEPSGVHEHQLGDGRWIRAEDRALPGGGRVGLRTDITDLREREHTFRMLYEGNPTPMLVVDCETLRLLSANDAAVGFYGYPRDALLRLKLTDVRPETRPGEIAAAIGRMERGTVSDMRAVHHTAGGDRRIVKVNARLIEHEGRLSVLAAIFDMTEQQRMEEELRQARSFLKQIVDQVPTALFVKDMQDGGRYVLANPAAEALYGVALSRAVGHRAHDLFDAVEADRIMAQDEAVLALGSLESRSDELVRRNDGSARIIRTRKVMLHGGDTLPPRYIVGVAEDVTEQRARDARIAHMAHHDLLTDLPNRVLLLDRLGAALDRLRRQDGLLALLYLDLDGFKAVNDAWGHAVGDQLLKAVGGRLRGLLRDGDTAARFGGDEFALLQTPIVRPRDSERLARRVIEAMSTPFSIEAGAVQVGASVGVALAPAHGVEPEALLAQADAALYRAKRAGRRTFRLAAA